MIPINFPQEQIDRAVQNSMLLVQSHIANEIRQRLDGIIKEEVRRQVKLHFKNLSLDVYDVILDDEERATAIGYLEKFVKEEFSTYVYENDLEKICTTNVIQKLINNYKKDDSNVSHIRTNGC